MSALVEARESLSYWETRAATLPRTAVRRRREARAMAARWRDRVSQAELAEYGPGLIGTIFMLLAERRVPMRTRHTGERIVRAGRYALVAGAVFAAALMALVVVLFVALLVAVF
jgi:hypothetical protein